LQRRRGFVFVESVLLHEPPLAGPGEQAFQDLRERLGPSEEADTGALMPPLIVNRVLRATGREASSEKGRIKSVLSCVHPLELHIGVDLDDWAK